MKFSGFALIGAAAVGKSAILAKVKEFLPEVKTVDIDELFVETLGDIAEYGERKGWPLYFQEQNKIISRTVDIIEHAGGIGLIALPPSALIHHQYYEICSLNMNLLSEFFLICILADRDLYKGARETLERLSDRPYAIDREQKKQMYLYQSAFYSAFANDTIINDSNTNLAARKVCQIIKRVIIYGRPDKYSK